MNFSHILPSNTSLHYFPNNNASVSQHPWNLSGKWEAALMNLKYSMCVKTCDNGNSTVKNMSSTDESYDELWKAKKLLKIRLSVPKERSDY